MRRMDAAPLIANYRVFADYNRWFNAHLYEAAAKLPEPERRRDRGAFFGSIHGTLNHLVWADKLWLQRFATQDVVFESLPSSLVALPAGARHGTVLHEEWEALQEERARLDDAICGWVEEMPGDFPLGTMRYANMQGVRREHPAWLAITHFFNHQTHHRGQATTLLMQAGVDPGVTDLLARALTVRK